MGTTIAAVGSISRVAAPAAGRSAEERPAFSSRLTADQLAEIQRLRQRDVHVRQHEAAHQAMGGGAASFSYQQGPDGRSYAVGGEVPISIQTSDDPAQTIANMERVRSAALAPADPSAQDMAVAAQASMIEASARAQRASQRPTDAKKAAAYGHTGAATGLQVDVQA